MAHHVTMTVSTGRFPGLQSMSGPSRRRRSIASTSLLTVAAVLWRDKSGGHRGATEVLVDRGGSFAHGTLQIIQGIHHTSFEILPCLFAYYRHCL